jgi:pimeloyl-ACP methyl ester carboxylesterase
MRWALKFLGGLLVVLLVVLAVNQVVTGRETKPAKTDLGRIVKLKGGDIQVREDGPRRAPALVLLHGFDASMKWWTPSVPALARAHHVIRVDLLGHGGSSKPLDGYSMEDQARLVGQVLDRLRVRQAVLIGHSMGTDVALALAEQRPALVRGIVVVDEPASTDQADVGLTAKLGLYPLIGPAIKRAAPDSVLYDGFKVAFAPGFRYPRWVVDDNRRMTYASYKKSSDGNDAYLSHTPMDLRLSATRKSALVIFGDRDQLVDVRAAERSYRVVRNARVVIVHGAGHSPMFEKPAETTRLILAFVRPLDRRSRPPRRHRP